MPDPNGAGGGMPDLKGASGAMPGGGGGAGTGMGIGIRTEQKDVRTEAERWEEYRKNYDAQHRIVTKEPDLQASDFFGAEEMIVGYFNLRGWLTELYKGGSAEFDIISNKLSRTGGKYASTEAENADLSKYLNPDDPKVGPWAETVEQSDRAKFGG